MTDTTITTEAPLSGVQRDSTGTIVDQAKPLPKTETTTESTEKVTSTEPKGETVLTEGTKKEGEGETKTVVPEKYETFKIADGYEIDQAAIDKASPVFKELGLDQANAQKLVDLFFNLSQGQTDAAVAEMTETRKGWRGEVQQAFGSGIDAAKTTISRAIDAHLGTGEGSLGQQFRQALDLTGAGDHPAVVKAIHKFTSLLSEGSGVRGNNPSPHGQTSPDAKPKSAAQAMYPHLPSADAGR